MIAGATAVTLGLVGCGANDAEAGGLFGSVEKNWNNSAEVIDTEDTYIGYKIDEDFGNGYSAFGELSIDIDSTVSERKAYVGIATQGGQIAVGKQASVQKYVGDNTIDIFEGPSFDVNNSGNIDNAVTGKIDLGSVAILGSSVPSAGDDSYELGATTDLGLAKVFVAYAETSADVKNTIYGASTDYNGVTLGGALETEESAAGVEVDTATVVAAVSAGSNTLKGGFKDVENTSETFTVEGVHEFSKTTSVYANYQDSETDAGVESDVTTLGLRINF